MREVIFYRTSAGQCPVERFLDSLSGKQAQKVVSTEDLWEVRVRLGSNIFRLLGFFDGAKLIVLAHAFQKKTQKTPSQAIAVAEGRKRDYFRRKRA